MATPDIEPFNKYIGNGSATEFSVSFPYIDKDFVHVYLKRVGGEQVELDSGTDWEWANATTIRFPATGSSETVLAVGDVLAIQRETPTENQFEFTNQKRLFPEDVMDADDLEMQILQEHGSKLERALVLPPTSQADPAEVIDQVERVYESIDKIDTVADNIGDVGTVADDITKVNIVSSNISDVNSVADNISDVNTVADISSAVTTVSGISSDVSDVASIKADVQGVNAISSDVEAVANNATNINTVAGNIVDVGSVAANISNVNAVADNETNINAVNSNKTNINAVAGNASNINIVAGISSDITTVSGIKTDVQSVVGMSSAITTVNSNASNINAVAGNSSNINAVAGNATNINAVNANKTNIDAVAGNASNISSVAGNATNINAVANNSTNINTVATNVSAVTNCSTNMADIQAAPGAASDAAASATEARVWATGDDDDVADYEPGEHSSHTYASLAMAIANTPEDTPVIDGIDAVNVIRGPKGDPGSSAPNGGTTGQVLTKRSNADGDTYWADSQGGGGAVNSVNGKTGTVVLNYSDVGAQAAGNYATADTAQDITASKTFKAQQKLQYGGGDGCLIIGADVTSNTVTANTRKLGRMAFHTNESTTLNCAFVSTDTQSATSASVIMNCVEFGGRPADTASTSPDVLNFTVAKVHNTTTVAEKQLALSITKDGADFTVPPKLDGVNLQAESTIQALSATDSITLSDNTIYNGGTQTALTIALPATDTIGFISEVDFSSGATATTLSYSLPDIFWAGVDVAYDATAQKDIFKPVANKRYTIVFYYDGVNYNGRVGGV